ncbi:GNAT family N-acetyltransferase [Alkalihalobacillus sp. AL-G]|uniref:GNAT family N-acetyltransferase n=1 Tax=Alkalihalobacillus sp. AL-G TaxID=2926399 RepID=UPI0027295D11|nr:GNAT family N-acetyltransferase [Alkalihalobacillus sp. AL-G]WLD94833.1 GNAT family N-acetyltransferase [Alkalihalobacillus sp. AL-G]
MIRRLTERDNDQVMDFLGEERALNLFIVGDIENFGYETDFQTLWGEWNEEAELIAVLLRYRGNFIPYARGNFNVEKFAEIINGQEHFEMLSGKQDIVEKFDGLLPVGEQRLMHFAEIVSAEQLDKIGDRGRIHVATEQNIDLVFPLMENVFDFSNNSKEGLLQTLKTKSGRTFFIKEEELAIACASTTAENSMSAMVVGVCTDEHHRNKGLASVCLSALCEEVLTEGKSLCLFYDNPAAGSIYKRLGFKDIGKWSMWHKAVER